MKKFASILMSLVLVLFAGVVLSACGDDYKNMRLVVEYGNKENDEWTKVDLEEGLEFVLRDDLYKNPSTSQYELMLKVSVKGTKKKVDAIDFYCEGSFAMSGTKTVEPGEDFVVTIPGTGSTTMYFRPSVKSDKKQVSFNAVFYDELEQVSANKNYYPAVIRGGELELNQLLKKTGVLGGEKDLLVYTGVNGGQTNQDGVILSIVEDDLANMGVTLSTTKDDDGEIASYVVTDEAGKKFELVVNENRNLVTVEMGFALNSVPIRVESVYNGLTSLTKDSNQDAESNREMLRTKFNVVIVDDMSPSDLRLDYTNGYKASFADESISNITLYLEEEKGYNNTNVVLTSNFGNRFLDSQAGAYSGFSFNEVDINGIEEGGVVKYDVYLQVGTEKIMVKDLVNNTQSIEGVKIIEKEIAGEGLLNNQFNKSYNISSTQEGVGVPIKFVAGFSNLLFTGNKDFSIDADDAVMTYDITVDSKVLPNSVSINGHAYKNGGNFGENIFTEYKAEKGLEFIINAARTEENVADIIMQVYTDVGANDAKIYNSNYKRLKVLNFSGQEVSWVSGEGGQYYYKLSEFTNYVYFSFDSASVWDYPDVVYVDFKVLSSPTVFDGVEIEEGNRSYVNVSLTLNVVGTLDSAKIVLNNKNIFENADGTSLIESDKVVEASVELKSSGSVGVDASTVIIKSKNNNAILSVDKINWTNIIKCDDLFDWKLYIKSSGGVNEALVLETTGGDDVVIGSVNASSMTSNELQFVDVVSADDEDHFVFDWDESYVENIYEDIKERDVMTNYHVIEEIEVDEDGNTTTKEVAFKGYYLAIQRGKTVLFDFGYGNEHKGIFKVETNALSYDQVQKNLGKEAEFYSQNELDIVTFSNGYNFNITPKANNKQVAPITIVEVIFYYYGYNEGAIEVKEEKLYLEIASYTPITSVKLEATRDEICYINSLITDRASTQIKATILPVNATKNIWFATSVNANQNTDIGTIINGQINNKDKNGTGYIYALNVTGEHGLDKGYKETGKLEGNIYLNLNSATYGFELTSKVEKGVYDFNFKLEVFGKQVRLYTQKIKIVDYKPANGVVTAGLVNNNAYLSLQSNSQKEYTFTARVSNADADYKTLGYELYEYNNLVGDPIGYTQLLSVDINNETNIVTLNATGTRGGKFVLKIVAIDSYDDGGKKYDVYKDVIVTISDGTLTNPFHLNTVEDVNNIAQALNKHYVLASDIDLSDTYLVQNEEKAFEGITEKFTGSINGVIEINDGENTFYTQHKFTNLKLSGSLKGFIATNKGRLKNLVFENVEISHVITSGADANKNFDLGAIAQINDTNGVIENCSVEIKKAKVDVNISTNTTNYKSFNFGVYVGQNEGTINFYHDNDNALKSYNIETQMVVMTNPFEVNISSLGINATDINIGVVANNSGVVNANYYSYNAKDKEFYEYITAEIDLKVNVANANSGSGLYNLGGFTGINSGTINQVAVVGEIYANGSNISAGGLVGKQLNGAELLNSSSYGVTIEGGFYQSQEEIDENTQKGAINQNIGGAVGVLEGGTINNVYVLIINLSSLGYVNNSVVSGVDVVGGLVGRVVGDASANYEITYSNVQSFNSNSDANYSEDIVGKFAENTGSASKSIGGLVGHVDNDTYLKTGNDGNVEFDYCYVKANIVGDYSNSVSTLMPENNLIANSYFIGRVSNQQIQTNPDGPKEIVDGLLTTTVNNGENVYSLVYGYKKVRPIGENSFTYYYGVLYHDSNEVAYYHRYNGVEKVLKAVDGAPTINANGVFNVEENGTDIRGLQSAVIYDLGSGWDYEEYIKHNSGLPLIVDDEGRPSLIAIAEKIVVNVADYEFETDSEKIEDVTTTIIKNDTGILIKSDDLITAIVFVSDKVYNLVAENGVGLLDKQIIPSLANGEYFVRVLEGQTLIKRTGNQITFVKTGRVELEFVTIFNSSIKDRVVIYIEEGVNDFDVINNNEVVGADESVIGFTNHTTKLSLQALFGEGISKIDKENLLIKVESIEYADNRSDATNVEVSGLGHDFGDNLYSFDDIQILINEISADSVDYVINLNMYLNLSNYLYDNMTLKGVFGQNVLVGEKAVKLKAYQTASAVNINSSSRTMGAGEVLDVEIELLTSYVIANDKLTPLDKDNISFSNKYMYSNVEGRDSLTGMIEIINDYWFVEKLNAQYPKIKSLWEIFDIMASYKLNDEGNGYVYNYYFELKEEYKKLISLNGSVTFKFTFFAVTNTNKYDSVEYVIEPQSFHNIRLENFAGGVATLQGGETICEFINGERPSSMIEPGKSGLLKIFVDSAYARVDEIKIASSTIIAGNSYQIKFQQMFYDEALEYYIAMPSITDGNGALIIKGNNIVSYRDNKGDFIYDGVIYVRTVLDSNAIGTKDTFNITVDAIEYERDDDNEITTTIKTQMRKTLPVMVWYTVGISASVSNAIPLNVEVDDAGKNVQKTVYLIEKTSNNAIVEVLVYGYENQDIIVSASGQGANNINWEILSATEQASGAYLVRYKIMTSNLKEAVTLEFKVSNVGMTTIEPKSVSVTFVTVDYIPSSVGLKNTANDVITIPVNSSKELSLVWNSSNQALSSDDINQKLNKILKDKNLNILKYFTIEYYTANGVEVDYLSEYLDVENNDIYYSSFKIVEDDGKYYISALEEGNLSIKFSIVYSYKFKDSDNDGKADDSDNDGKLDIDDYSFEIVFGDEADKERGTILEYSFRLNFVVNTSEEEPLPIYTAQDFKDAMSVGENYILMNDIDLTTLDSAWVPVTPAIKSLDGNGKIIKLGSIQASVSEDGIYAGLFSTIADGTIIKNVVIDLSSYVGNNGDKTISLVDENAEIDDTYFGFLAGRNEGIIYNSEIISLNASNSIKINTSTTNAYVGLLVGENAGNITNSRVGTSHFEVIKVDNKGNTTVELKTNGVLTISVNETNNNNKVKSGIVAGFVASNTGIISASYYYNINLINYSSIINDDLNMTAGFVAINSGYIYNSYVSGTGITADNDRATKNYIYSAGFGSVAGFVYLNEGEIENCYTNIYVRSKASGVSGFVYHNASNGVISQCYSASLVSSDNLSTQLPFVGAYIDTNDATKLLSEGELNNCYYLQTATDNFDTNFVAINSNGEQMDLPKALNSEGFVLTDNLSNFAFVEGTQSQSEEGVWTYYTTIDKNNTQMYNLGKTNLPQLTSANKIARSIRYMVEKDEEQYFVYANNYGLGTEINPYIIRDHNEYNSIFNISSNKVFNNFNGYIRFVDNISFLETSEENETEDKYLSINTSLGYTLGDSDSHSLTVIDGNGMTISDVKLTNNDENSLEAMGLFNEIHYSVVKNLDIEFADFEYSSTGTICSGGLAGYVKDSFLINIDLISNSTQITAQNFAGGLAGVVAGNSGLFNISSNLNVEAAKEADVYYQYLSFDNFVKYSKALGYNVSGATSNEEKYKAFLKNLSYAGGIAGVIDIGSTTTVSQDVNVNKITVGETGSVTVVGDIAGFVSGYFGRGVFASRVKAFMSDTSYVEGSYISAGMVGENYGRIRYSQVSYEQSRQEEVDDSYADYIMDIKSNKYHSLYETDFKGFVTGTNKSATTRTIAGGLVGVNYGGQIEDSYSKATICADSYYIGGLVGVNINGLFNTVYSQTYIDLTSDRTKMVGGLIGYNTFHNTDLTKVYKVLGYNSTTDEYMKIDEFVSGMIVDVTHLQAIGKMAEDERPHIAYVVGKSERSIKSIQNIHSNPIDAFYLTYEDLDMISDGVALGELFTATGQDLLDITITLSNQKPIDDLYDLTNERQLEVFENMFGSWSDLIWEKDNEKYFPILNENPIITAYEIYDKDDLKLVELHPDADFIVYGTINLSDEKYGNPIYLNHVLDVVFSGRMIGYTYNNTEPAFVGIKLITDETKSTAGFFYQTQNASITNITFEYDYLSINTSKESVGLVSAIDNGSEFTRINVLNSTEFIENLIEPKLNFGYAREEDVISFTHTINNNCSIFTTDAWKYEDKQGTVSVGYFGGMVGDSTNSIIQSCKVEANYELNGSNNSHFGGLVGYARTGMATRNDVDSLISSSSFKGKMFIENASNVGGIAGYSNNVIITGNTVDAQVKLSGLHTTYFGGVVGYQSNTWIADATVDLVVDTTGINQEYLQTTATEDKTSSTPVYVGGVAGYATNTSYKKNYTNNNDEVVEKESDYEIIDAKVKLNLATIDDGRNCIKDHNSKIGVYSCVGGLVGYMTSHLRIMTSVAWINGMVKSTSITFGGLVATAENVSLLKLDNCFAYIENDDDTIDGTKDYSGLTLVAPTIVAGGMIGQVLGEYMLVDITNSSVAGAIWARDDIAGSFDVGLELTLGGMLGKILAKGSTMELRVETDVDGINNSIKYQNQIVNSFTTLTLESSVFSFEPNIMSSETYNVSAILGKTQILNEGGELGKSNTVEFNADEDSENMDKKNYIIVSGVYYSSDMNLAVEEKATANTYIFEDEDESDDTYYVFGGNVQDLVATVMYVNGQNSKIFISGWVTNKSGLPYREVLLTALIKMEIIVNEDNAYKHMQGSSLAPNIVKKFGTDSRISAKYNYYLWDFTSTEEVTLNAEGEGTEINGFITFGGATLKYTQGTSTLAPNSVISNLQVNLVDIETVTGKLIEDNGIVNWLSKGGLFGINNGTIFNVTVDYYFKSITVDPIYNIGDGAGIARINNGNLLYVNNVGTIEGVKASKFGGLTSTNNGFIAHSTFLGTIDLIKDSYNQASGIVNENSGVIYNSYSAGVVAVNNHNSSFVIYNNGTLVNCYYDYQANAEIVDIDGLTGVITDDLQNKYRNLANNKGLIGKGWYGASLKTIADNLENADDADKAKVDKVLYNYGYPIYRIEQLWVENNELVAIDMKGLTAGTGASDDPYLVTHGGTMMAINGCEDTTDLYFKLINDVDFEKSNYNEKWERSTITNNVEWKGIGTNSYPFAGSFVSGERFRRNETEEPEGNIGATSNTKVYQCMRYINNAPCGLFAYVEGASDQKLANISNIAFGSSNGGSGVIAENIKGNTKIKNVLFSKFEHAVSKLDADVLTGVFNMNGDNAGLIGTVSGTNVYLENINKLSYSDYRSDLYEVGEEDTGEVLSYTITNASGDNSLGGLIGCVSIDNGLVQGAENGGEEPDNVNTSDIIMSDVYVTKDTLVGLKNRTCDTVGGMIGLFVDGNITLSGINVSPKQVYSNENIGGVIGLMQGGTFLISNDADDLVLGKSGTGEGATKSVLNVARKQGNMGGLVGVMEEGTFMTSMKVGFNLGVETSNIYANNVGGVVGLMKGGLVQGNVEAGATDKLVVEVEKLRANANAGGLVGQMKNGTISNFKVDVKASESDSIVASTFGGVAGMAINGTIQNIDVAGSGGSEATPDLCITMVDKIGGLVGHLEQEIDENNNQVSSLVYISNIKVENLYILREEADKDSSDDEQDGVGGLFGVMETGVSFGVEGENQDPAVQAVGSEGITINTLTINCGKHVSNIGGLIGLMKHNMLDSTENVSFSGITIMGSKNVGGFIGQYAGGTQIILGESFANYVNGGNAATFKICLPTEKSGFVDVENVGGIFGYYNSSASMLYDLPNNVAVADGEGDAQQTTDLPFSNTTPIYSEGEIADEYRVLGNGSKLEEATGSYKITNVGGIAGKTKSEIVSGTNTAKIGATLESFIDLTYIEMLKEKILNISNVGGLVGTFELEEADELTVGMDAVTSNGEVNGRNNVGGIIGYIETEMTISAGAISVSTNVNGLNNVGLMFGASNKHIKMQSLTQEVDNKEVAYVSELAGMVKGYQNVGGVIGALSVVNHLDNDGNLVTSTIQNVNLNQVKVYGIANIGGVAGYVHSDIEISNITNNQVDNTEIKVLTADVAGLHVVGNANVGGVIGYADVSNETADDKQVVATLTNIDTTNTLVSGIIYDYATDDGTGIGIDEERNREIVYIYSSLGMAVGYANNVVIKGGTYKGLVQEQINNNKKSAISTVGNYIPVVSNEVSIQVATNMRTSIVRYGDNNVNDNEGACNNYCTVEDQTAVGSGGLIGTLKDYTEPTLGEGGKVQIPEKLMGLQDYKDENNVTQKTSVKVNVYLPNGINVGGIVGLWGFDSNGLTTPEIFNLLPTNYLASAEDETNADEEATYIAGAVAVGGIVGRINSQQKINYFSQYAGAITSDNKLSDGKGIVLGNIVLQEHATAYDETNSEYTTESVFGEYVGAIFGFVDGTLTAVQISSDSKLTINNEQGSSYGTIAGKLRGSLSEYALPGEGGTKSYYSYVPEAAYDEDKTNKDITEYGMFLHGDNFNYGGLVGTFDVNAENQSVLGLHWYNFTVYNLNTWNLETDEQTVASVEDTLMLTSHIVNNKYKLNIAYTLKNYDNTKTDANCNPYDEVADEGADTIWHYEYTMFQMSSVSYSDSERIYGGKAFVSIYDSRSILEVILDGENDMVGTVYLPLSGEGNKGNMVLYTKYGIAELITTTTGEGENEELVTELTLENIEDVVADLYNIYAIPENLLAGLLKKTYFPDVFEAKVDIKANTAVYSAIDTSDANILFDDTEGLNKQEEDSETLFKYFRSSNAISNLYQLTTLGVVEGKSFLMVFNWDQPKEDYDKSDLVVYTTKTDSGLFVYKTILGDIAESSSTEYVAGKASGGKAWNGDKYEFYYKDEMGAWSLFKINSEGTTKMININLNEYKGTEIWKGLDLLADAIIILILTYFTCGGTIPYLASMGAKAKGVFSALKIGNSIARFGKFLNSGKIMMRVAKVLGIALIAAIPVAPAVSAWYSVTYAFNKVERVQVGCYIGQQYSLDYYEGKYGFMASQYSYDWSFDENNVVGNSVDSVIMNMQEIKKSESETMYFPCYFLYYSATRPEDYAATVSINGAEFKTILDDNSIELPDGDIELNKYIYDVVSRSWYLNIYSYYGTDSVGKDLHNDFIEELSNGNNITISKDGDNYYMYSGFKETYYKQAKARFGNDFEASKMITSDIKEVTLSYKTITSDPSADETLINGFDYISKQGTEIYWKLSTSKSTYGHVYIKNLGLADETWSKDSAEGFTEYYFVPVFEDTAETTYLGSTINTKVGEDVISGTYYLSASTNVSGNELAGYTAQHNYYRYLDVPVGFYGGIEEHGDESTAVYQEVQDIFSIIVYNEQGTAQSLIELINEGNDDNSITLSAEKLKELDKYYIENYKLLVENVGTDYAQYYSVYKHFIIRDGKLYQLNTNYRIKEGGDINNYSIQKVYLKDIDGANYLEGKNKITVKNDNGEEYYVLTRYKCTNSGWIYYEYNDNIKIVRDDTWWKLDEDFGFIGLIEEHNISLEDFLNDNNLLPARSGGYVKETLFVEQAMVSYAKFNDKDEMISGIFGKKWNGSTFE